MPCCFYKEHGEDESVCVFIFSLYNYHYGNGQFGMIFPKLQKDNRLHNIPIYASEQDNLFSRINT